MESRGWRCEAHTTSRPRWKETSRLSSRWTEASRWIPSLSSAAWRPRAASSDTRAASSRLTPARRTPWTEEEESFEEDDDYDDRRDVWGIPGSGRAGVVNMKKYDEMRNAIKELWDQNPVRYVRGQLLPKNNFRFQIDFSSFQ